MYSGSKVRAGACEQIQRFHRAMAQVSTWAEYDIATCNGAAKCP
jgi:hypothetical protein